MKQWSIKCLIFLSLLTSLSLILCSTHDQEEVANVTTKSFPIQEGWNSKLYITKMGRTQAIVQYGHMAQYENQEEIQLDEGVEVDFYNQDGQHTSHLTSNRGTYHEQTQNVKAQGRVIAISDSGVTLRTSSLAWDNQMGKIQSDTLVQVTTQEGDTLWGKGFQSEADLSHWVIRKPWGVSDKRIELASLDSAFTRKKEQPVSVSDSTKQDEIAE